MELVNDIYWAVPLSEMDLEDSQKEKFEKFIKRHYLPALDNGDLAIYKTDLDKFYSQFGYSYFDRTDYGYWKRVEDR